MIINYIIVKDLCLIKQSSYFYNFPSLPSYHADLPHHDIVNLLMLDQSIRVKET